MRRGFRKFFAFVLVLTGCIAAPLLARWGHVHPPGSYFSMIAGAAHHQYLQLENPVFGPRTSSAAGEEEEPPLYQNDPQQPLPVRRMLAVENILQNPQLPNGCEATALATVLQYYGYDADKMTLAYDYIPRVDFSMVEGRRMGGDPAIVYPGDPAGLGYYCMPRVVEGAANQYLAQQSGSEIAHNITGASQEELQRHLASGSPVLVWKTIDDQPPRPSSEVTWYLYETGEEFHPYANLHVVVLIGYDESSFYICDPQGRQTSMPTEEFMENFRQTGRRAMTITR